MTSIPDGQLARVAALEARREELLTVKEYAFMVGQHVRSVRRRIRAGKQRGATRVGGQWRIDASVAIDALRESRL